MNRLAFTWLAGCALLCACQPTNKKITINGTLTGVESDTLLVMSVPLGPAAGDPARDTVAMQQGQFTLQLDADTLPQEVVAYALPSGNEALDFAHNLDIVAFPGEKLTVKGSLNDYVVEGSDFYTAFNQAQKAWKPAKDSLDAMLSQAHEAQRSGTVSQDSLMKLSASVMTMAGVITDKYFDYIRQHLDEDLSVFLAGRVGSHLEEALLLLGDKAKNGAFAALYRLMDKAVADAKAREEAQKTVVEGAMAPDFTLKDIEGKDLSLSSLRGKYVVLDFWGSWCGWCIKGIPEMKKYYAKYKDRMEILGIDCRDTEEKWKAAVKEHELPWLHVRNEENPDVSTLYAIQGYPTKIVIDPEGKIAKIVVGEDPAFYEYLDELFK